MGAARKEPTLPRRTLYAHRSRDLSSNHTQKSFEMDVLHLFTLEEYSAFLDRIVYTRNKPIQGIMPMMKTRVQICYREIEEIQELEGQRACRAHYCKVE